MKTSERAPARSSSADRDKLGQLLGQIMSEKREGARLPSERELAAALDVGRNKLREYLSVLEAFRVIEMRPQSGIYTRKQDMDTSVEMLVLMSELGRPLSRADLEQSMEVRRFLETQTVRLASQRHTSEDLDALAAVIDRQEATIGSGASSYAEDQEFHLLIAHATRNDVFVRIINTFFLISIARRKIYFLDEDRVRESVRQHREMLAAIESRNPELCSDLMLRHIRGAEAHYLYNITSDEVE